VEKEQPALACANTAIDRPPTEYNGNMKRELRVGALLWLLIPLLGDTSSDYLSVKRKLDLIESERLQPGSRVTLTSRELNAYVVNEAAELGPGVRDPRLQLGDSMATGTALIDFLKVRQAAGQPSGWVMTKLLGGERPVRVTARITSGSGRAVVDVDRVEISGVTIDGKMLDYLIQHFLIPQFPEAKVGRPFDLAHRIDRLEVKPDAVGVVLKPR
jgi:hypothetical protein